VLTYVNETAFYRRYLKISYEFGSHLRRAGVLEPDASASVSLPIQTEMFDRTFGEGETDVKKTIATQNPVGRIGTPEEIASAVLWLSSPGAAFTTGQDIIVDGGYTAR
jgi:NAD(P)-dependent dehydrogenase (short-subunit alcohol dehydrogenase family)